MSAISTHSATETTAKTPMWARTRHAHHFRSHEEEFDACKLGMWLFLTTEVLLFAGIFVAYAIFRAKYPEAFSKGSHHLDWRWGGLNTVILLISSFTIAYSIRNAQTNNQVWLRRNLLITLICGGLFLAIKFIFEYGPKWAEGKRPGNLFLYPGAENPHEPIWWSIYYSATGIHASHVVIGMALIFWLYIRSLKGTYGPKHYTGVEVVGLYWHLVDLIWIFLFPLLYLIH
ncbi:MAG: cytochrome c oxidase subunit 3 family protein [Phycisphaeraceae bacterium]|nr:cytochrome c oxidase subunit 3 family protein [Phycisphaeraceae bacterium]